MTISNHLSSLSYHWSSIYAMLLSTTKVNNTRPNSVICDSNHLYDPCVGIPIQNYANHIAKLGLQGLFEEYFHITHNDHNNSQPTTNAFKKHGEKNRYQDIPCIDDTRVILENDSPGSPSTSQQQINIINQGNNTADTKHDYIHANFVDGFQHKRAYICTQGPLVGTTNDLWKMIWQEKVLVIVMLTKCTEANHEKCNQYWPIIERKLVRYGNLTLQNQDSKRQNDYQITRLLVTHVRLQKSRIVYHMQYLQWPDHGTPQCSLGFHRFLDEAIWNHLDCNVTENVDQWQGCSHGPPIVVHCSAGIGRTGTLLALDIQRKKLSETGLVDIPGCVKTMRRQRWLSIQKPEQYAFLSLALLEYAHDRKLISGLKLSQFFVELVNCVDDDDENPEKCITSKNDMRKRRGRRKDQMLTDTKILPSRSQLKQGTIENSITNSTQNQSWNNQYRKVNTAINMQPETSARIQEKSILLRNISSISEKTDKTKRKKTKKGWNSDEKSRTRTRRRKD